MCRMLIRLDVPGYLLSIFAYAVYPPVIVSLENIPNLICLTWLLYHHCISLIWRRVKLNRYQLYSLAFQLNCMWWCICAGNRIVVSHPVKMFQLTSCSIQNQRFVWCVRQIKCEIPSVIHVSSASIDKVHRVLSCLFGFKVRGFYVILAKLKQSLAMITCDAAWIQEM